MHVDDPRTAFVLDPEATFLNHGSFGATPRPVLEARSRFEAQMERQPVAFMFDALDGLLGDARDRVAGFVGAPSQDLVFVDNATSATNTVLRALDWSPGDRIVTLSHVYGAVRQAVRHLAERYGVEHVEVDVPFPLHDVAPLLEGLARALPGARLAVLDHITSPTGLRLPLPELVGLCREAGVPVFVDGAHAPGQIPLDLAALDVDGYTGNLHKWAFAPKGTAFLYLREGGLPRIPLSVSHGWKGSFTEAFHWQGTRDFSSWLAAPAGLDLHAAWGGEALMARNDALADEAAALLARLWDVELPAPSSLRAAMAALPLPVPLPADEASTRAFRRRLWLDHRIEVPIIPFAGRPWIRVSAQVYNDLDDYVHLGEVITAIRDGA